MSLAFPEHLNNTALTRATRMLSYSALATVEVAYIGSLAGYFLPRFGAYRTGASFIAQADRIAVAP